MARNAEIKADREDLPTPIKILDKYKVKHILERYRDEITINKRSADTETYILDTFIRQDIANLTLAQITPAHFSTYRDKRLKQAKAGTVNRELSIIKHAFDVAEHQWNIPIKQNPISNLKKLKVSNARTRRMSNEEYKALQDAVKKSRNAYVLPLIRFAVATGMRRGEILRLRWREIDIDNRTLHIPVTKNGHPRTIPLSSEVLIVLNEIKGIEKSEDREHDTIFPFSDNAARLAWQRLTYRAGIEDLHSVTRR